MTIPGDTDGMRFTKTIASASVAAVLGLAGVSVAGAVSSAGSTGAAPAATAVTSTTGSVPSGPSATGSAAQTPAQRKAARQIRLRHLRRRAGVLAAQTIGIKPRVLAGELRGGKTIAQAATDHGVQPQTVINTLVSAANAKIDAALTANKISAERAAKLKVRFAQWIPNVVDNWHPHAKK